MILGRQDYRAYMQSDTWHAVRQRYWRSKLPKWCKGCLKPPGLGFHLHHKTYKRLGAEWLMDLIPLCPECHRALHAAYDKYRAAPLPKRDRFYLHMWQFTKRFCNFAGIQRRRAILKQNPGIDRRLLNKMAFVPEYLWDGRNARSCRS